MISEANRVHGRRSIKKRTIQRAELLEMIGPDGFLKLVESYGGANLYVPKGTRKNYETALCRDIGETAGRKMMASYGGDYLRIPLAREFRVRSYRSQGLSAGRIATRIGMTQSGVERIIKRLRKGGAG